MRRLETSNTAMEKARVERARSICGDQITCFLLIAFAFPVQSRKSKKHLWRPNHLLPSPTPQTIVRCRTQLHNELSSIKIPLTVRLSGCRRDCDKQKWYLHMLPCLCCLTQIETNSCLYSANILYRITFRVSRFSSFCQSGDRQKTFPHIFIVWISTLFCVSIKGPSFLSPSISAIKFWDHHLSDSGPGRSVSSLVWVWVSLLT